MGNWAIQRAASSISASHCGLRDPKLPYYKGTFDQLRPGHLVKVTLGKPATSKSKDLDKAPTDDDTPYAVLVLVTGEEAPPPPKKKK